MNTPPVAYCRPEDALIVQCAQLKLAPNHVNYIRDLLDSQLDWHYVIESSHRHGVIPLVSQTLRHQFAEQVPDEISNYLEQQFKLNLMRNLLLKSELLHILRRFNEQNIPIIALKGPIWADLLYANLALRVFADLDILVHEKDRTKSEELLFSLGFENPYDTIEKKRIEKESYHYRLHKESKNTIVELHWLLAERFWHAWSEPRLFWESVSYQSYGNTHVLMPRPEDQILYACNHGFMHLWERLGWLCDLAVMIQMADDALDWSYLFARAKEFKSQNPLFLGLALLHDLWPASKLPADVIQKVARNRPSTIIEKIRPLLVGGTNGLSEADRFLIRYDVLGEEQTSREFYKYATRLPRIRFKPSQRDFEWISLPKRLHFLYYFLRPPRLIVQYGLSSYIRQRIRVWWILFRSVYKHGKPEE